MPRWLPLASSSWPLQLAITIASIGIQLASATHYTVTNVVPKSPGGTRFTRSMGTARAKHDMSSATSFIFHTFRQTGDSPSQRKDVDNVRLYVEGTEGVAYTWNNEIHLSAKYIKSYAEGDVAREIKGVIYHEMTHVWQWNGKGETPTGLIEGIADYVRLKSDLGPSHWVKPGEGIRWDQGYDVTARFLDYCGGLKTGFVAKLNKKMRYGYKESLFEELLGKSVDELWAEYKEKYGH